ncbi:4-(cytidine 5'-diphospho)-2-C-methyl-D-erythritol kinase [Chloroflexota bacterium]
MDKKSGIRTWRAYAKINLTLEVLGKREDGYHEIASVVQAINLYDVLSFQPKEHIYLDCNIPELVSPNNLVFKAAKLLQDFTGSSRGAAISMKKAIPMASGLGGGSSDAAVALQALNEIWELDLSSEDLEKLGQNLGSDISFFFHGGGTALAEGRGEKVRSLPSLPKTWVVLVKPPINLSNKTRRMYAGLDASHFGDGQNTWRMIQQLQCGEKIDSSFCYNVFEDIAFSFFPGLEEYRQRFLSAGAGDVHLAGAGPVLFTLVEDKAQGEEIRHRLDRERIEVYLTETL